MKTLLFLLSGIMICPLFLSAQPTITNCENFSIGTVLKFQECSTTGVYAGNTGANQSWDFSMLSQLSDTSIETMVDPVTTTHGYLYPDANLVEQYSDGTFVYANSGANTSYLLGYIDTVNDYTINYTDSMLYAIRPVTYHDSVAKPFSVSFTSPAYNYTGQGTSTIVADGYGTLILPTGSYDNVLRLKLIQSQNDTSIQGTPSSSVTVSYIWFDNNHTSALLKIDSTQSGSYISKDVEYLISETTSAIKTPALVPALKVYPNPAMDQFVFTTNDKGVLFIVDQFGRKMGNYTIEKNETAISLKGLSSGLYYVEFQTEDHVTCTKLIVE